MVQFVYFPADLADRAFEGFRRDIDTGDEQLLGVSDHLVGQTQAEAVMLCSGNSDTPVKGVSVWNQVGTSDDHRRSARAERKGRKT